MDGFIEVTRFMGRDERGLSTLLAISTIQRVREQDTSRRALIALSVILEHPVDPKKAGINEVFEVEESFEEVQKRMRIAASAQLPY